MRVGAYVSRPATRRDIASRRDRTHALVEGALLTDIAIVFLLMRAYLPILFVRPVLLAFAAVPIAMLVQRRGFKLTVLATIAAFILFSALVGPLLGIAVLNAAIAGSLVGLGRRVGLNIALNLLWSGVVYSFAYIMLPTVLSVIIFRYPVGKLIKGGKNFIDLMFRLIRFTGERMLNILRQLLTAFHAPAGALHQITVWQGGLQHIRTFERPLLDHWQITWMISSIIYGILTMYLIVIVIEIVLRRVPDQTLERQRAA